MQLTSPSAAIDNPGSATTTSLWSYASWAAFGLVIVSGLLFAGAWQVKRDTAPDPQAGPLMGILSILAMGVAWEVALLCASLGSVCGFLGVRNPSTRTRSGWAALALNSAFVVLSVADTLDSHPLTMEG